MATDKLIPFFDVQKAIEEWGEVMCEKSARTRKQKQMIRRQFGTSQELLMDVQIDWSHLSVSYHTDWQGALVDVNSEKTTTNAANATSNMNPSQLLGSDVNVLFQTDFKNDTSVSQQYTLKIEKTTNSSCTTEIEHGVTNGIELNATLSIGDVLELGTGFSHEVSLNKMEGETIEKEVTWGAESAISVPANKRATAQMEVIEKQQSGDFTVFTTMIGYVIIKYISLKDSKLVFGHSGKINRIVEDYLKIMKGRGKCFKGVTTKFEDDSKVQFQTKGNCKFRFGIKQVITIEQEPDNPRK